MSHSDTVRDQVAQSYEDALLGKGEQPIHKTGGARFAGYDAATLADIPTEISDSSFGCGNPLAFAGVQPGDTVLDLGSGAGLDLLMAAQKVGPTGRVIGVDMTDAMIERARANAMRYGYTNIEVRKGLIEALPVETNSVDWVISNCVINLSPEKDKVFAEIARVLKPGGRISISDIVVNNLPGWVRRSAALYMACVSGGISEPHYLAGLQQAGLADAAVTERQHYDAAMISDLAVSMLPAALVKPRCCNKPIAGYVASAIAPHVQNRIWSAKFYARKTV